MVRDHSWDTKTIYTRTKPLQCLFINGLLLFIKETDICNFADDLTLYTCGKDLDAISNKLELYTDTAIK